jgi:serine protease
MLRRPDPPGSAAAVVVLIGVLLCAVAVVSDVAAQRQAGPAPTRTAVGRFPPSASPRAVEQVNALVEAATRRLDHVPGEVLIKFRPGVTAAARNRALAGLRSRPSEANLAWSGSVARLRDPGEPDAERLAAQLRMQPEVDFAQPNYIRRFPARLAAPRVSPVRVGPRASPARVPTDPSFGSLQWNMRLIDAPGAWTINAGGTSQVIVAVLDSGLTTTATVVTQPLWTGQGIEPVALRFGVTPDLSPSRVVSPRDIAFQPGSDPLDFDGHGTHVASTIAEEANNAIALVGLAYNVRLMPVKVCVGFWELMLMRASVGIGGYVPTDAGGCTDADISDGIRYAVDSGARVINISLGGSSEAPVVRDALQYAVSRGAFVAASMGNSYEAGNDVEYPAAYATSIAGMMSVGAVGKSSTRAYYSSTGSHIEIAAPGGSDLDDDGGEDQGFVWQVTLYPQDTDPLVTPQPRFDRFVEAGYIGTSMATPHVSALAALLISQGVFRPAAIEAAIIRSAEDLGPTGRDTQYGHGLIDARAALFGLGIR